MSLHRTDHVIRDGKGRPLRRVSRYIERRGQGTARVVLEAAPERAAASASGEPIAAPPEPQIDLEDTATIRELRRELADVKARLANLEIAAGAREMGIVAADAGLAAGNSVGAREAAELARAAGEELVRQGERLTRIEAALAALGAAAEAAARDGRG